jgi:sarcosine oxidase subunit beta
VSTARKDVIVIGGGIVGASTALHLRQRGLSIAILERDRVGQRASGVNFGGVRQQGRDLREIPLAIRSRRIWSDLKALIGTDGEFSVTGHLRLARTEADVGSIETYNRAARELGLALELLGRNALSERYPWLGPMVVAGSLCPEDGQANPRIVAPAFAHAARRLGVEIHEGTEVTHAEKDGGVFRLSTRDGRNFAATVLVNAAGAWAGHVAAWFGEAVAIKLEVPQVLVTEPAPHAIEPVIGVIGGDLYLRQIARGNVIFGGGEGRTNEDWTLSRPLPEVAAKAAGTAVKIVPHLANLRIIRMWTGVDGDTADGSPVIGSSQRVSGLYHGFGFCGHGFQLGVGAGAVLAELITAGETSTPIDGLGIWRFR